MRHTSAIRLSVCLLFVPAVSALVARGAAFSLSQAPVIQSSVIQSSVIQSSIVQSPIIQTPAIQNPTAQTGAQEPSFRSTASELVVLPVIVTERADHYVQDLTRHDFAVYDNDRHVTIEHFSNEDTPVTVGLVVDASSSMRRKLGEVIAASLAFARSSNPDDELFVVSFNDSVRHALPGRLFLPAEDLPALSRALTSLVPEGQTSLYDALLESIDRASKGSRSRKVLVVVSDGGDNASETTLDRVLARARASEVAIYTIGIYDDVDPDKNPRVLKALATATGGERYLPRSAGPLMQACQHIAREIRSGYTIGYIPPDRDGVFHRVRVEIVTPAKRKLTVRTRPGYFAAPATK
jgi:Ca-activated chloride channel homolog